MASRTKQKEEARARRIAEERARVENARRQRRTRMLAGVVLGAAIVVGVAIAISSSGGTSAGPKPGSAAAKTQSASVNSVLAGIPESGNRIGSPNAKTVVTEFGDLECPVCAQFAVTAENQLIASDVRAGKVQLVYKSLESATGNGPDPNIFPIQQAAAYAAGLQGKAWYYILLFYHEQGQENTAYVNNSYLNGIAQQVPGLNLTKWSSQRTAASLQNQVIAEEQLAKSLNFGYTPTITVQGPKGEAQPIVGDTTYASLESEIKAVQ